MDNEKLINLYNYYSKIDKSRQVAFKGPFDKHIVSAFGNLILTYTRHTPQVSRRVFKIFVELAQNVAFYSYERAKVEGKSVGIGSLAFGGGPDGYFFISVGNMIRQTELDLMRKKCELINKASREELRALKRQERSLLPGSNDNAHIGLIMIALLTERPINMSEIELENGLSFFTLNLLVKKNI